jgi:adenylate cyclase
MTEWRPRCSADCCRLAPGQTVNAMPNEPIVSDGIKRKLTTILCADVKGYSRLMGRDEAATLSTLKDYRSAMAAFVECHHGRVVNTTGDSLMAAFDSPVEAVQCAAEV